jgi:hypothetical protein
MSECSKASETPPMPSSSNSSGVAAVRMAVDAGSPAEVAANNPAKTLREVGGVKGTVSPSPSAQPT